MTQFLDTYLHKVGYKIAVRRASSREIRRSDAPLSKRESLIVLPANTDIIPSAWQFVRHIALSPEHLTLVWTSDEKPRGPSEYLSAIEVLQEEDLGLFGLPGQDAIERCVPDRLGVAVDLTIQFYLPAAYLVGISPAPTRVGFFNEKAQPFRDIMFEWQSTPETAYERLADVLPSFEPPLLPFRPKSTQIYL